jgi:hypothetical protein
MLQAILLTSSLLLMLGMCASLMWLASARGEAAEMTPVQTTELDA